MRLLIVEDEIELCNSLAEGLRFKGYAVDTCNNGADGEFMATTENYDLIVLDLNLPKMDGLEILKNIRKENKLVNILILTARDSISEKVDGLDKGANDYMTKPFHFEELEARIRNLLRSKTVIEDCEIICGEILFNTRSRDTVVKGQAVTLTNKETSILEYFVLNRGCAITAGQLLEHVWDESMDAFSNSVRMHISSLRKKLRIVLGYDPIQNIIGKGYILREDGLPSESV